MHPRFRTPHRAIALQALWASVLVLTGTYRELFTRVIFSQWIFFALLGVGVVLLRRRPSYQPVYRLWAYPLVPILFVIASSAIVVNRLISEPKDSLAGLSLAAVGVPVYYLWTRLSRSRQA